MSEQNDPNQQPPKGQNPWVRHLLIWGGIFMALLLVVSMVSGNGQAPASQIAYSDFVIKIVIREIANRISIGDCFADFSCKIRDINVERDLITAGEGGCKRNI